MARKKIVFVIVEGPSDEETLELSFNRIYDSNSVYIHVVHGDLTTMKGNIRNRIADILKSYANSNHLKKTDFKEVIHIVDMDGAYIDDDSVVLDDKMVHPFYSTEEIRTHDPDGIRLRNRNKRANTDIISSIPSVWGGIPYQAYYMSCNLDHVLHNKLNCDDEEKERNSYMFAKKYKDDVSGFIRFISESDFSLNGDYLESWKYIKQGKHSLERHTNLGICFIRDMNDKNI